MGNQIGLFVTLTSFLEGLNQQYVYTIAVATCASRWYDWDKERSVHSDDLSERLLESHARECGGDHPVTIIKAQFDKKTGKSAQDFANYLVTNLLKLMDA